VLCIKEGPKVALATFFMEIERAKGILEIGRHCRNSPITSSVTMKQSLIPSKAICSKNNDNFDLPP
jgi:hypothetical protein